jgi:hypothetical protein
LQERDLRNSKIQKGRVGCESILPIFKEDMKKCLLVLAMVFMFVASAGATPILTIGSTQPTLVIGENYWEIYNHPSNPTAYGSFSSSYNTEFSPPTDPFDLEIYHVLGTPYIEVDGVPAYLVVKDGNHDPAIYIFDLAALGWDGLENLRVQGLWMAQGAISHVSIYDPPTQTSSVPEPATMFLLGSGLIGLAGYGRKKFFKK